MLQAAGFLEVHLRGVQPEEYGLQVEYDRAFAVLRGAIPADALTHVMADGATMIEDEATYPRGKLVQHVGTVSVLDLLDMTALATSFSRVDDFERLHGVALSVRTPA